MDKNKLRRASKFLSLVLRHEPGKIGIQLDAQGWASIDGLLEGMARGKLVLSLDELRTVVAENNKKRFSFNEDQTMIRASQGHSVKVSFEYPVKTPPEVLYHGTVARFMTSIREQGLKPKNRHHVHLSTDVETANAVGARRGVPVLLTIDARRMADDGYLFYLSDNGVWLTENVPALCIRGA